MTKTFKFLAAVSALALAVSGTARAELFYYFNLFDHGWTPANTGTAIWSWAENEGWTTTGSETQTLNYLTSPYMTVEAPGIVTGVIGHRWNFDTLFDGGVLEYRVNSGAWSYIPLALTGINDTRSYNLPISQYPYGFTGQYTADGQTTDFALGTNDTAASFNYGDTIQFRLVGSWDSNEIAATDPNWQITVVGFRNLIAGSGPAAVPEPGTWAAAALLAGGATLMFWRKRAKVL